LEGGAVCAATPPAAMSEPASARAIARGIEEIQRQGMGMVKIRIVDMRQYNLKPNSRNESNSVSSYQGKYPVNSCFI
jgi:hypothetical protein